VTVPQAGLALVIAPRQPSSYARAVAGHIELTKQQRCSLADDGYLLVPSVLAGGVVHRLAERFVGAARQAVEELEASPGAQWEEPGVFRLRLDHADPDFADYVRHPLLLRAAEAVIGPGCQVSGLSLRAPLPGSGHQGLHPDFYPGHSTAGPWQVLAAMWCITAFTCDNGPIRVIPGSHHVNRDPAEDMAWPGMGPHPAEVKLLAPAGSLILFNSASLWHSGTLNYSPEPRLAMTAYLDRAKARDC
jgi:Phytanoyl-CoA dioxygenase (PhyH)